MAANDENLNGFEDLFDADNPDDMADFMSMLEGIDSGSDVSIDNAETTKTSGDADIISDLFGTDEILDSGEDLPFVSQDDEDILKLLDAVGEETAAISDGMDSNTDDSVGELADLLASFEDEQTEPDVVPVKTTKKEKKKGSLKEWFAKIRAKFHKEPTEEELIQREQEETEEREWEAYQQEKSKEKKEASDLKKQAKKEDAERKKQQREEKKAAKRAIAEEKKAAKQAERERKRGPVPKSQLVPVKPLMAFVVLAIAFSVVFLAFTDYSNYTISVNQAKEMFIHQKYKEAYEELIGLDIKKKDEKFFEQVQTIRIVDKELDAYYGFIKVENYELALESLVQGIGKYGVQAEYAKELKLENEMYDIYEELLKEVTVCFGMTEQEVKDLYDLKDKKAYTQTIEKVARDAAIRDGIMEPVNVEEITEAEK